VTGEKFSDGDFVTVLREKPVSLSPVNLSAIINTTKKPRTPVIGVRSSVMQQRVCRKSPFVSQISLEVTIDVEKSFNDQLQLASLTGTRLKSKYCHVYQ
jgi:hypothetical protein